MMHKNIYLTGFMGSGKSRIGKNLANKLNVNFIDTDDVIELKYKKSIAQIFEVFGEKKFREIETEIISELINRSSESVIALGGGSLISEKNQNLIEQTGTLIYIQSGLDMIWERTKNKTKRPLLLDNGKFPTKSLFMEKANELMEERLTGYNKASIKIERDGKEADEVVEEILRGIC